MSRAHINAVCRAALVAPVTARDAISLTYFGNQMLYVEIVRECGRKQHATIMCDADFNLSPYRAPTYCQSVRLSSIVAHLKHCGLTQGMIAKVARISRSTVSKLNKGSEK